MDSIKEIFKIGRGPSSSHTMGPERASQIFIKRNPKADFFEVVLYGSLALTGKGHLTDFIIKEVLGEKTNILFNYDESFDYHPNGMKLKAFQNHELIDEWLVFSVGGGELKELNERRHNKDNAKYPHHLMENILTYVKSENITLSEYVDRFEDKSLNDYLLEVFETMEKAINRGLNTEGVLPGRLQIKRKAKYFYNQYLKTNNFSTLLFALSLASSEENASGGIIVTAPTCGSCGVVPAALFSFYYHLKMPKEKLINALKVAGLIGNLVKFNASISGAEVGCQGEIGVACCMASGMIAYLKDARSEIIEYASEIALEHHLGMTCDPIDGMVQIPCIERNALSAQYAFNASEYAIMTDGTHHITLDSVIEVMNETGKDMHSKYRETSLGGLALINRKKAEDGKTRKV